jgi:hypothetical protein
MFSKSTARQIVSTDGSVGKYFQPHSAFNTFLTTFQFRFSLKLSFHDTKIQYLNLPSLGWVNWSVEIVRLSRDIGQHLRAVKDLMLEIEVRTPTIVVEFYLPSIVAHS